MLEYKCDWCGRQKKPKDAWILGLALERNGVSGTRRQFETLRGWSAYWAAHPLAVHLCCEQHKEKYLDALFTSPWPAVNRADIARAAHLRRTDDHSRKSKDDSGAAVEWYIEEACSAPASREQKDTPKKKRPPKSRKPKPPAIVFSETDHLHARFLGILLESPKSTDPEDLNADDAH